MSGRILVHFGGGMATNHTISMRALGKTLSHLQTAIDRAYLDNKHGNIWKYAKMQAADYEDALFVTQVPEEGGYILEFLGETPAGKFIINRISSALRPAIERSMQGGLQRAYNLPEQAALRQSQFLSDGLKPLEYQRLIDNPPGQISRKYGDRSIVKEFDQIAAIIRSKNTSSDSMIEFKMTGDISDDFIFDNKNSKNFHSIVSEKQIWEPVIYLSKITKLDHKNMKGKIENVISKKESIIHFVRKEDFFLVKPYLGNEDPIQIIACPLIEYGAFDPKAGDVYFVGLITDNG